MDLAVVHHFEIFDRISHRQIQFGLQLQNLASGRLKDVTGNLAAQLGSQQRSIGRHAAATPGRVPPGSGS